MDDMRREVSLLTAFAPPPAFPFPVAFRVRLAAHSCGDSRGLAPRSLTVASGQLLGPALAARKRAWRPSAANGPAAAADHGPGQSNGVSERCATSVRDWSAANAGWPSRRSARAGDASRLSFRI